MDFYFNTILDNYFGKYFSLPAKNTEIFLDLIVNLLF